jgi:hypothetical protein
MYCHVGMAARLVIVFVIVFVEKEILLLFFKAYKLQVSCKSLDFAEKVITLVEMVSLKTIAQIVQAQSQTDGVGALVQKTIGSSQLRNLDPFLMLDEFSVTKPAGSFLLSSMSHQVIKEIYTSCLLIYHLTI